MRKIIALVLALFTISLLFVGCGGEKQSKNENGSTESTTDASSTQTKETNLKDLKQGDEVSIVGQVASSSLVNGDTLWVQVKQNDGSFIVYHCQLKSEYVDKVEAPKLGSVAKVKGLFMSFSEFDQENTANLVQLCDCELVG